MWSLMSVLVWTLSLKSIANGRGSRERSASGEYDRMIMRRMIEVSKTSLTRAMRMPHGNVVLTRSCRNGRYSVNAEMSKRVYDQGQHVVSIAKRFAQ
jgi:hypothetical protein